MSGGTLVERGLQRADPSRLRRSPFGFSQVIEGAGLAVQSVENGALLDIQHGGMPITVPLSIDLARRLAIALGNAVSGKRIVRRSTRTEGAMTPIDHPDSDEPVRDWYCDKCATVIDLGDRCPVCGKRERDEA